MIRGSPRRSQPDWCGLEGLEPRVLMAATLLEPMDDLVTMAIGRTTINLANHFIDSAEFHSSMGTFYAQLLSADAPIAVTNFNRYANEGRYVDTFIHRSADLANGDDFVIQGGGFIETAAEPFEITNVQTFPAITNQFRNSNLRGTLAMARLGGQPNSATSQWFVNVSDNTFLDTTDNNGFTVFGRVIGDGMDIVDAIAALPTFNKSAELSNSAMGELPLVNYTDGQPLTHANLVSFSSIVAPGALAFTVVSNSRPDLFEATSTQAGVNIGTDGQLTLNFSGQEGTAEITIRATDRFGNTVDDTFTIRVSRASGQMGVIDEDGKLVVMTLRGPGAVSVTQAPGGAIENISLVGTSTSSTFKISSGKRRIELGDLSISSGSLGVLKAGRVDFTGDLFASGFIRSAALGDVGPGAVITFLGLNKLSTDTISLVMRDVRESSISSQVPFRRLEMDRWIDADATADNIAAPRIDLLKVTGAKKRIDLLVPEGQAPTRGVVGNFGAGLSLSGSGVMGHVLNVADIRGSLTNANWNATGTVNKITVAREVSGAVLRSTRSFNNVTAGRLVNSSIFAGVKTTVTTLPDGADDFNPTPAGAIDAFIGSVTALGIKGSALPAFENSLIAARDITFVKLGLVDVDNATPHGVAAENLQGAVTYSNASGDQPPILPSGGTKTDDDFTVRLL